MKNVIYQFIIPKFLTESLGFRNTGWETLTLNFFRS